MVLVGVSSFRAQAKPSVRMAAAHIPGVPGAVLFTADEQAKITSYRQLMEELAYRHCLPYEVADGIAAENEARGSAQVYLTGWVDGQPILQSYDHQYHASL